MKKLIKALEEVKKFKLPPLQLAAISSLTKQLEEQEKELASYRELEKQQRLIKLPIPLNSKFFTIEDEEVIEKVATSIDEVLFLHESKNLFTDKATATRQLTRETASSISNYRYTPRSELSEDKANTLRNNDKVYYQLHKEEINKKDNERYHLLHPNARYYKKRVKTGEQISINDVLLSATNQQGETE